MCRRGCCHLLVLPALLLCFGLTSNSAQSQERATARTVHEGSIYNGLPEIYQKWLDEDVRWIITEEERNDFNRLATDRQRDEFVVAFWEHRNPNPGAPQNKFKEQHYKRLAYSNQHFASGVPGYRTDRGRIYIVYGPPDQLEDHPNPTTQGYPSENWRYLHIVGIGEDVTFEFVDTCRCGEYRVTVDPSKRRSAPPKE